MRWEAVPAIPLFLDNTAAFIHDLDADALSNAIGRSDYVRVNVLTPEGVLDGTKKPGVVKEMTQLIVDTARRPALATRTRVLISESQTWAVASAGTPPPTRRWPRPHDTTSPEPRAPSASTEARTRCDPGPPDSQLAGCGVHAVAVEHDRNGLVHRPHMESLCGQRGTRMREGPGTGFRSTMLTGRSALPPGAFPEARRVRTLSADHVELGTTLGGGQDQAAGRYGSPRWSSCSASASASA